MAKSRWALPGVLLGLGLALALAFPTAAVAQSPNCQVRDVDAEGCKDEDPPREEVRCIGPVEIETIVPMGGPRDAHICQKARIRAHCDGRTELVAILAVVNCPDANGAWAEWCLPPNGLEGRLGGDQSRCAWRDYYGHEIRLAVRVPPHILQAVPYPVGFVAREDPWGVFRPTTRVRWLPPQPQIADSGWRLWSWGSHRSGQEVPFPCAMDEEELLAHHVPAGTTCLRMMLATAPDFEGSLAHPRLAPATLWFPVRGWQAAIAPRSSLLLYPNQTAELSFPYASHPATGEAREVDFGSQTQSLPAFIGYFHRWWPVGLKVEAKRVEDLLGQETECVPVEQGAKEWNCWTERLRRGRWETRTVVKGKRWVETARLEGLLRLQEAPIGWRYPALHPARLIVQGPEGTYTFRWVDLQGTIWLYLPLAVREGQGVVCSDPTCGGYLNRNTP
ncbi:MAG: hypothetical protein RQ891_11670 [Thermoflexus sp.]|nr:hypothetical protein [Thermoflexus sp.]